MSDCHFFNIIFHLAVNVKVKVFLMMFFNNKLKKTEKTFPVSKLLNAAISTTTTLV
jgi:hypothetical protein